MTILVLASMELATAKPKELGTLAVAPIPAGGLCPGEKHALEVTSTDGSGKTRKVKLGRNDEIDITWELGPVGNNGDLVMTLDPREAWGKEGRLTVSATAAPDKPVVVSVPLRFDCTVTVDFSGAEGEIGVNGGSGANHDARGTDGNSGEQGQPGEDGPEVHVRITGVTEPRTGAPVLQAEIQRLGDDEVRYVAFAPVGGELVVMANGGRGGLGGQGGDGGDAAAAGQVGGGIGGGGGDGGNGGNGGSGGAVVLFVDPSAGSQVNVVVENAGGAPGLPGGGGALGTGGAAGSTKPGRAGLDGRPGPAGPAPEIRKAVVAPLW